VPRLTRGARPPAKLREALALVEQGSGVVD
jgi:hypothetical protein